MSEFDFGSLLPEEEKKAPTPAPIPIIKRTPIPRKPQKKYQLVNKGDLVNIMVDTLQDTFELDPKLMKRLLLGFPQNPFGGERKTKDGGWNSITYAIFETILASKRLYTKKGSD